MHSRDKAYFVFVYYGLKIWEDVNTYKVQICSSLFSINAKLCKQIYRASIGDTLSVVLPDCFINKMEWDVVIHLKGTFYKRFGDDIYRWRKKKWTRWIIL